jgi:hypothetical protein
MTDLREQHELWQRDQLEKQASTWTPEMVNPMVRRYGRDPEKRQCKGCQFLYARPYSKRFYKCELRGKATSGPGTDHRVRWPACAKYQLRPGSAPPASEGG